MDDDDNGNDDNDNNNDDNDDRNHERALLAGTPSAPPWYRARGYNTQASYK